MPTTTQSLAITAVLAATACSTSYVPRTPGRLFVTMDSGKPSYVRDGQRYDHGILGGGLQEAVRGNPRAEAAAAEYRSRMSNGLLVMVVGAVCTGVAIGSAIADESGEYDPGADRRAQTKLLVATGCLGLILGGSFYAISAEPYRWDAINIFNDSPPPGYQYGAAQDALRSVTPISSRAAANKLMSVVPAPSSSNLESRASFSKPSSSM